MAHSPDEHGLARQEKVEAPLNALDQNRSQDVPNRGLMLIHHSGLEAAGNGSRQDIQERPGSAQGQVEMPSAPHTLTTKGPPLSGIGPFRAQSSEILDPVRSRKRLNSSDEENTQDSDDEDDEDDEDYTPSLTKRKAKKRKISKAKKASSRRAKSMNALAKSTIKTRSRYAITDPDSGCIKKGKNAGHEV